MPEAHYRAQANKAYVWFLLIFVGLFFVVGVISLNHELWRKPTIEEMTAPILITLIAGFLIWRMAAYFFKPVVTIKGDRLIAFRFFPPRRNWPYARTARWETRVDKVTHDGRGRRLAAPNYVEKLIRVGSDGKRREMTLPAFAGNNERLLADLRDKSGLPMDDLGTYLPSRFWGKPKKL